MSREYLCTLVLSNVEVFARRLHAREGLRTGRRRTAAGRGCRHMYGRRKYTVSFCPYVCLGVCGGVGGWGWGGGRGGGRGVEDACKDARVVRAGRSWRRRHSVLRRGYPEEAVE